MIGAFSKRVDGNNKGLDTNSVEVIASWVKDEFKAAVIIISVTLKD
jgi:hypothetical protein